MRKLSKKPKRLFRQDSSGRLASDRTTAKSRSSEGEVDLSHSRGGSLADQAYRQIEELVCTLQLPPGTLLSEFALADRLGIGRTPIREALQRLALDGLVLVIRRRGILVSEINLQTQLRLLEMRRVVEQLMARLAAERARPEERAAFADIAAKMLVAATKSDDISFMRLDRSFNQLVASTCRNDFAARSINLMSALSALLVSAL